MLPCVTVSGEIQVKPQDLLSPSSAAHYLHISRMTLWRWVRDGKVKPIEFDGQKFFDKIELQPMIKVEDKQP
jgi:hypothetical protein